MLAFYSLCSADALCCTIGHVAAFAVNAVLVAGQWQHRAWRFVLHPSIH